MIAKAAKAGIFGHVVGSPLPREYMVDNKCCGVTIEKPDSFHELIIYEELAKTGSGGLSWGLLGGTCIGLPPVFKFGDK